MSDQELSSDNTRAIIRRHVHELRNVLNSMDLEVTCMQEEPAGVALKTEIQNLRRQIVEAEKSLRSLSDFFMTSVVQTGVQTANDSGSRPD